MKRLSALLFTALFLFGGSESFSKGTTVTTSRSSYSSGRSSSSSSSSKPASVTTSKSSYSAGTPKSSSPPPSAAPAPAAPKVTPPPASSSFKGYSSGTPPKAPDVMGTTSPQKTTSPPPAAMKSYSSDSAAARAQKEASSKTKYQQYLDSKNTPPPAAPVNRPAYSYSSSSREPSYWEKRREREARAFGSNYSSRPVVVVQQQRSYGDGISPFFTGFLLSQSLQSQAAWAYNHRSEIDDRRWKEMVEDNAEMKAEIEKLKATQPVPDPNFTLPGVDPDLVFSEETIKRKAWAEEQEKKKAEQALAATPPPAPKIDVDNEKSSGLGFFGWTAIVLVVGGLAYYLVFKHKWKF